MSRPNHAVARRDEIVKNMRAVLDKVRDGQSLTDGYGMQIKELHDISRDLDDFVLFAGYWDEHCFRSNLNPRDPERGLLDGLEPGGIFGEGETRQRVLVDRLNAHYATRQHPYDSPGRSRCASCGKAPDAAFVSVPVHVGEVDQERRLFDPDYVVHPGATLREWREETHLSSKAAATACARMPLDLYEGVEAGTAAIDEATAAALAHGTQIPATLWLALERGFREGLARGKTWVGREEARL